ncbi:MAG: TIGR04013 family B12-binding domain/radical SAM domain-containing protein [Candidatus Thorarchaeota archaeon]
MKRIIVVFYYHRYNFYSLNAIAGALETDEISESIDFYYSNSLDELIEILKELVKSPVNTVIAISFFTTQLFETYDLVKKIKSKYGGKFLLIAGGAHPTGDPLGTLEMGFDVVVVGEGEKTIIDLIKNIDQKKNWGEVRGIAYYDSENNYRYTGKRPRINLSAYPPFPLKNTRYGAIEITRGCPYVCYFCQIPYISGINPRHRSIENICKYVKELHNYYGDLTDIRFITPNAFSYGSKDGKTLNLDMLENLLINIRKIIGPKGRIYLGTFPSEVRPEHVTQDTLDLVLKYGDNDNITIGAQSGSQRILDSCHRGHTVEDINKAVELTLENNLKINVDFIFGLPGENDEDVKQTVDLMHYLANQGARIHTHTFIPLPQTPFSGDSVKNVHEAYKKEMTSLISKGLAFGNWKRQEKFAKKVTKYLKNKKL